MSRRTKIAIVIAAVVVFDGIMAALFYSRHEAWSSLSRADRLTLVATMIAAFTITTGALVAFQHWRNRR